jgi:hypothetical protein
MIHGMTPTKIYSVVNKNKRGPANKRYNLIVVEDEDGDLQHMLFSDSDVLRGLERARQNKEDIPKYTIRMCCGTSGYILSLVVSLGIGVATGYFLQ